MHFATAETDDDAGMTRACYLPRRGFLAGLAALGAGSILGGCQTTPQASGGGKPFRIDVHHHLSPPAHIAALKSHRMGELPSLNWTPAQSIADMDQAGVAVAIMSITTPGIHFGDNAEARRLARECNDYAAKLAHDYPGRFGSFASLPLPDVDASLREIEYALDVLKADGIGLMTSFGDKWLGNPAFRPVMAELNRRKAVVYTHPTVANCCRNLIQEVPDSVFEFAADTTRAIASIVFTGTAAQYPDIRWIFSHAGGTMPFLVERFTRRPLLNPKVNAAIPNGVLAELKKFHYDTAQASHPMALASLLKLVPVSQVMFGTDFPYRTSADHVKGLVEYGFSAADLQAIDRDNALRLMPGLKA